MRVLGRVRLSRSTEESTSIERQREIIEQWAGANGHSVVGWAEDIDVSGAVDPFETKGLGEWLGDRAAEWDILCAWKLDRLGRNAIQLSKLFGWCQDHDKTLVSCSESIDLSTWAGRMLASVIAGLAEGEREAIRERVRGSRAKLRQTRRWPGGKPPFGYSAVKNDGGGWHLEVDPLSSQVVRRIVDDLIDGKPINRIATELNDEGYRTPSEYYATVRAGKPKLQWSDSESPKGQWAATPLRNMLRSKALRGFAHHKGETVRDADGMPVQLAEPLVSLDEWELIQAALDRVQESRRGIRRNEASPLSGVVVCYHCGFTLHHSRHDPVRGGVYRYYKCSNKDTAQIPAADLEDLMEERFLAEVGHLQVRERVWVPGDSKEADLREAVTALDELSTAAGRAVSSTAKQRLQAQLAALDARIAELESAPVREARWEYRPIGTTYSESWNASDVDGRRALLARSGITLRVARIAGTKAMLSDLVVPAEIIAKEFPGWAEREAEPLPIA